MAHTRVWDETTPADTDLAKDGARDMRYVRVDLKERLALEHSMAADDNDGRHLEGSARAYVASAEPTPPTGLEEGRIWLDSDNNNLKVHNGSTFVEPAGKVVEATVATLVSLSNTPPVTWTGVDITAYRPGSVPARFAVLYYTLSATRSAGDGTATFRLFFRKNGSISTIFSAYALLYSFTDSNNMTKYGEGQAIVPLDSDEIFEYSISESGTISKRNTCTISLIGIIT